MIEKRKRAQRSRFSGSTTLLKKVSPCGGADGAKTRSAGYKASPRLTIRIFCGRSLALTQVDRLAREGRQKEEKVGQHFFGGAGKPFEQAGGTLLSRHRGHETCPGSLPERRQEKLLPPPVAPTLQRT